MYAYIQLGRRVRIQGLRRGEFRNVSDTNASRDVLARAARCNAPQNTTLQ
ncbi:MAG: hypothetical protein JWM47_4252 [Acidimicrobiales bacterium]|nr:hypothetical protein [Acidimicrobiales bacterium]